MSFSRIVRSSRVLVDGTIGPRAIHISDGTITAVGEIGDVPPDAAVDDFGDLVIMPGLVDSHVHVNEPGRTAWEGFETATRAAAAGGITTIVDMPLNSIPPVTTVAALREKVAAMEGKCWVDVGLWGGVVPGNAGELVPMVEAGALGFKCFMIDSGVPEFGWTNVLEIREALAILRGASVPLLVHAEVAGPIDRARPSGTPRTYQHYLESRPAAAELEAIDQIARLCRSTGGRAHIVHLSAADAVAVVRGAMNDGVALTAETTPHYLHFAAEEVPDGATQYKCAPPIRTAENRERLWQAVQEGVISMIVSDHSPCTPALKKLDTGDFMQAWGGIASVELLLPVTWTEARRRGVLLEKLPRWLCEGPAALAGLQTRKGRIAPGFDADLVVWNPEEEKPVDARLLQHRHPLTPYDGETLRGKVVATWLRGAEVYRDGVFADEPSGSWVR